MSYKIVADSCCELPEELLADERVEIVPLELFVGEYHTMDDETFDQADFLSRVAACRECPRSACPSPESYMRAFGSSAERVYVVTLSSQLSGSYNSAVLAANLYREEFGDRKIHVFDSESASGGETQIVLKSWSWRKRGWNLKKSWKRPRASAAVFLLILCWIIWKPSERTEGCLR